MVEVRLQQFTGRSKGLYRELPLDHVVVVKTTGEWVRVGFLDRKPYAVLRFHRYLADPDLRESIRVRAGELRHAQFGWPIAGYSISPPNPAMVKSYLSGETKKKSKKTSTIWVPESAKDAD